jgi:hypothetical protein
MSIVVKALSPLLQHKPQPPPAAAPDTTAWDAWPSQFKHGCKKSAMPHALVCPCARVVLQYREYYPCFTEFNNRLYRVVLLYREYYTVSCCIRLPGCARCVLLVITSVTVFWTWEGRKLVISSCLDIFGFAIVILSWQYTHRLIVYFAEFEACVRREKWSHSCTFLLSASLLRDTVYYCCWPLWKAVSVGIAEKHPFCSEFV